MPDLYGHLTPQGVLNGSLQTIVYANNYNGLINKPSINSVELQGNKTAADLGLLTAGDIPVDSVNGKQGVVILDGDDIEYEAGTSVNSKITDLEAEISSGPVISVNGQQGVVELDGTDINYSLSKTLNQKIDEVEASIPVVSYPVTSVNSKTGAVVLDDTDIEHSSGVSVNSLINTIMNYTPVYGNTASGAIATFNTSLALPLQDCTIEINAVQDLHGYDKPWSGGNGKNLFDEQYPNIDGSIRRVYVHTGTGTFTLSTTTQIVSGSANLFFQAGQATSGESTNINGVYSGCPKTVTTTDGYVTIGYRLVNGTTDAGNPTKHKTQLEKGSTATAYEPYSNICPINGFTDANIHVADDENPHIVDNVTAISWQSEAGTVYGGSLDVTSGVLTVTHGYIDLGSLSWNYLPTSTSYPYGLLYSTSITGKKSGQTNLLCPIYPTTRSNFTVDKIITGNQNDRTIYVVDSDFTDGNGFKTAVSGIYLVYELATPVTYQLTPTQISAIVGTNNVFTDTNGDTSVMYACSLKDYIDSQ